MAICKYCRSGKQYESNCSQCGAPIQKDDVMERFRSFAELNDQLHLPTDMCSTSDPGHVWAQVEILTIRS
jgi:hypothetical protein